MFKPKTTPEPSDLDKAISRIYEKLQTLECDSDEYAKLLTQVERLHKMKTSEKKDPAVKPEAWVAAGAQLASILVIVGFEQARLLTSKAVGFVNKSRI